MQAPASDGPPMRHNKALALAPAARLARGCGTGSHLLPEDLGHLR